MYRKYIIKLWIKYTYISITLLFYYSIIIDELEFKID